MEKKTDNAQKSNYKSRFLKLHLCCIFLLSFRPHSCCGRHGLSEPLVLMWGLAVWRPVEGVHECSETLGGGLHRSRHQTGLLLWWSGEWTEETSVGENRNSKCGWRFFSHPAASKNCIKCCHIHVVIHILLWCQEWFSTLTWRTKLFWSSSFSKAVLHMPSSFLMFQVKRRHRVNGEISKIFRYVKSHGRQPGRHLSCLPSGLASFTSFALRLALEDQRWCSGSPQ